MNKLARMAVTSHSLSVTAMEEASRTGERTADLEHLLLALSLNEQTAGQMLRGLGVTLDVLREALAAQRAEELASLGVIVVDASEQRIVFHETGGYEWSERALHVINQSGNGAAGDAAAVLRALLDEPSGRIADLLQRVGISADAVRTRLDEVEGVRLEAARTVHDAGAITRSSQVFIPATVDKVWALLSDPARVFEWDLNIASVDTGSDAVDEVGSVWGAHTITHTPGGKPVRLKEGFARQNVELIERERPERVSWRFTYPDQPKANLRRLNFVLEPAAGGTQLGIAFAWEFTKPRTANPLRIVMRPVMRPLMHLAVWMQAAQIGASVSRVFR